MFFESAFESVIVFEPLGTLPTTFHALLCGYPGQMIPIASAQGVLPEKILVRPGPAPRKTTSLLFSWMTPLARYVPAGKYTTCRVLVLAAASPAAWMALLIT